MQRIKHFKNYSRQSIFSISLYISLAFFQNPFCPISSLFVYHMLTSAELSHQRSSNLNLPMCANSNFDISQNPLSFLSILLLTHFTYSHTDIQMSKSIMIQQGREEGSSHEGGKLQHFLCCGPHSSFFKESSHYTVTG